MPAGPGIGTTVCEQIVRETRCTMLVYVGWPATVCASAPRSAGLPCTHSNPNIIDVPSHLPPSPKQPTPNPTTKIKNTHIPNTNNQTHRQHNIRRLAAAQEAALAGQGTGSGANSAHRGARRLADRMGGPSKNEPPAGGGPTSLFILTEENPIRKYVCHEICRCCVIGVWKRMGNRGTNGILVGNVLYSNALQLLKKYVCCNCSKNNCLTSPQTAIFQIT